MTDVNIRLFTLLGIIGGILVAILQIISLISFDLTIALARLYPLGRALVFTCFFGIALKINKWRDPILIIMGIAIFYYLMILINPFPLNSTLNNLRRLIFITGVLMLLYNFWEQDQTAKLIFGLRAVGIINIFEPMLIFLYVAIGYWICLAYWLNIMRINFQKSVSIQMEQQPTKMDNYSKPAMHNPPIAIRPQNTFVPLLEMKVPPQLLFFCPSCKVQKTDIHIDFSSDQAFLQKRTCHSCGSFIFQYWAPITKKQESNMIWGASMFATGMIANIVGTTFSMSVLAWILAIIVMISGIFLAFKTFKEIRTITSVPNYASEVPALEPKQQQVSIITRFAVQLGIRALVMFFIIFILA